MLLRPGDLAPTNPLADPLLAGAYEFTITYARWQQGHVERFAMPLQARIHVHATTSRLPGSRRGRRLA